MAPLDPAQAVKLARIRMALRRLTGRNVDVESLLLGDASQAAASIKEWRALGSADLSLLLDQWLADPHASGAPTPAKAPAAAPPPPPPPPPDDAPADPVDPDEPKPPADRRYLRGAR